MISDTDYYLCYLCSQIKIAAQNKDPDLLDVLTRCDNELTEDQLVELNALIDVHVNGN